MSGEARTDAELLADHLAGDPRAFGLLTRRHAEWMWGVAVRAVGRRVDADDAVQEALMAAFRRAASYRGEASVRTWLHRITVNVCIDRIRSERLRRTVPLPAAELPARRGDLVAEVATRMAIDEALALLSVDHQMAVVLVELQGCSVAEAAEILEVPVGTVKSRCARGRARLAVLLGHLREEER